MVFILFYIAPPPSAPSNTTNFYNTEQQSSNNGSNKPLWSLDYYTRYFDVDTSQVSGVVGTWVLGQDTVFVPRYY